MNDEELQLIAVEAIDEYLSDLGRTVSEARDITSVCGITYSLDNDWRNYRITLDDESVADWHVVFDIDYYEVIYVDAYQDVI